LDDGPKLVTPIGNVIINSSPADQCFGAVDRIIRGYVAEDNCTGFLNNVDIKIKVNPVYPTPDNCGPMINKWLREGKEFNTLKIEYAGGCDETHLKNRVPIIKWSIDYDGLTKYRTEETQCPLCNTCIIFCGCEDKVQPIYTEGCHPILQSANRLDDFWNLVYGQYKSFTLIDYDTGEVWYNVKFNDDMKYDHRHRIWSQSRTVSLIWRPCCANYPVGGTCSTHGMMNFKPKRDDCIKKKECEG
ncbi:MAG: hypothetical protein LC101_02655, partial [Flavobacteriales bacterium]|nr:hypothetical protein [Flavobacteriales bacterium]